MLLNLSRRPNFWRFCRHFPLQNRCNCGRKNNFFTTAKSETFLFDLRLILSMPLTGLVAAARKRTALIEEYKEKKRNGITVSTQTVPKQDNVSLQPSAAKQEVKRSLDFSGEIEQASKEPQQCWQDCKHLKQAGERKFCKRYMTLCAEDKCNRKYMNGEDKELDFKRILRGK
jgi:hypothetical protein